MKPKENPNGPARMDIGAMAQEKEKVCTRETSSSGTRHGKHMQAPQVEQMYASSKGEKCEFKEKGLMRTREMEKRI